jgi:hypothetical protein
MRSSRRVVETSAESNSPLTESVSPRSEVPIIQRQRNCAPYSECITVFEPALQQSQLFNTSRPILRQLQTAVYEVGRFMIALTVFADQNCRSLSGITTSPSESAAFECDGGRARALPERKALHEVGRGTISCVQLQTEPIKLSSTVLSKLIIILQLFVNTLFLFSCGAAATSYFR